MYDYDFVFRIVKIPHLEKNSNNIDIKSYMVFFVQINNLKLNN